MEIDKFIEEIENLKKAKELLQDVYLEIGPYRTDDVSKDTWDKVRIYFKFDDSE